jgi:hypothetical protein
MVAPIGKLGVNESDYRLPGRRLSENRKKGSWPYLIATSLLLPDHP